MPAKPMIRLCVRRSYRFGYLVRTMRTAAGEQTHLLSRKNGRWVKSTPERIQEDDIPSECLFPVDELPESSQIGRPGKIGSGKAFTAGQEAPGAA